MLENTIDVRTSSTYKEISAQRNDVRCWVKIEKPSDNNIKGLVLICHGLNVNPDTMRFPSLIPKDKGLLVITPAYTGHRSFLERKNNIREKELTQTEGLLDEHRACYEYARKIASDEAKKRSLPDLPIYLLGYSMGATISLADYCQHSSDRKYSGVLLLAPAIKVKMFVSLFLAITKYISMLPIIGKRLAIPSANLRDYRVSASTNLVQYKALAKLIEKLKPTELKRLENVVEVGIQGDELISQRRIKSFLKNCSHWDMVQEVKVAGKGAYHLVADETTAGKSLWNKIGEHMQKILVSEINVSLNERIPLVNFKPVEL